MGRCDTPKERIENMLHVKQMFFPDQPIDWGHLLDQFAASERFCFCVPFSRKNAISIHVRHIVACGSSCL